MEKKNCNFITKEIISSVLKCPMKNEGDYSKEKKSERMFRFKLQPTQFENITKENINQIDFSKILESANMKEPLFVGMESMNYFNGRSDKKFDWKQFADRVIPFLTDKHSKQLVRQELKRFEQSKVLNAQRMDQSPLLRPEKEQINLLDVGKPKFNQSKSKRFPNNKEKRGIQVVRKTLPSTKKLISVPDRKISSREQSIQGEINLRKVDSTSRISLIFNNNDKIREMFQKLEKPKNHKKLSSSFYNPTIQDDYFGIEDFIQDQRKKSCCCSRCYTTKPHWLPKVNMRIHRVQYKRQYTKGALRFKMEATKIKNVNSVFRHLGKGDNKENTEQKDNQHSENSKKSRKEQRGDNEDLSFDSSSEDQESSKDGPNSAGSSMKFTNKGGLLGVFKYKRPKRSKNSGAKKDMIRSLSMNSQEKKKYYRQETRSVQRPREEKNISPPGNKNEETPKSKGRQRPNLTVQITKLDSSQDFHQENFQSKPSLQMEHSPLLKRFHYQKIMRTLTNQHKLKELLSPCKLHQIKETDNSITDHKKEQTPILAKDLEQDRNRFEKRLDQYKKKTHFRTYTKTAESTGLIKPIDMKCRIPDKKIKKKLRMLQLVKSRQELIKQCYISQVENEKNVNKPEGSMRALQMYTRASSRPTSKGISSLSSQMKHDQRNFKPSQTVTNFHINKNQIKLTLPQMLTTSSSVLTFGNDVKSQQISMRNPPMPSVPEELKKLQNPISRIKTAQSGNFLRKKTRTLSDVNSLKNIYQL